MLSNRAKNLKSSPTLALVAKAKELTQKGHPVISLTVGEPDWPTYAIAAEEGINAIKTGFTKYTAANGTIELRQAIAKRTQEDLGLTYAAASEIAVTSGAKFAIFACLQVLCDKGDEVIIPSPYWVSYPAMAELADATPRTIICDESVGFKLTPELLRKNINQNTKVFLFCSPSNPTGFCYTAAELKALADVLKEFPRVCIISDDMYNRLLFNREKTAVHILNVAPELKDRTIVINGGSKAYSMTGWRIGWACGPAAVIKAVQQLSPTSKITLLGFSLGGNLVLRLAGEWGKLAPSSVDSVIAVAPPVDLLYSSANLRQWGNRGYDRYFVQKLIKQLNFMYTCFCCVWHNKKSFSFYFSLLTASNKLIINNQHFACQIFMCSIR